MNNFEAKIYTESDWDMLGNKIISIEKECFKSKAFSREQIFQHFHKKNLIAVILKSRERNEIVGFSYGFPSENKNTFFIWNTAIKKIYQGRGLIGILMMTFEKEMKNNGYKYLEREADVSNSYADKIRKYYKKRIVKEEPPHDSLYSNGKQIFFRIRL